MRISRLSVARVRDEVGGLRPPAESRAQVAQTVAQLIAAVRSQGDRALVEATRRFDWRQAGVDDLIVSPTDLELAWRGLSPALRSALELARDNLTWFHRHELPSDWMEEGPQGQRLGIRHQPVGKAGLYVPGGKGSYASTVVMNAVPALVAGVKELVICTPPGPDGGVNPTVLAAAHLMGVRRVFRVGGAQAIAAMAFGSETVPRVDVICGPGNAYVMEAKRQVYGEVGLDGLAGPSEVLVVADSSARPGWVAADLLAQEEHGSGAQAVLMAETEDLCGAVARRLEDPGRDTLADGASQSGADVSGGRVFAYYPAEGEDFRTLAAALVDAYAPEHLEVHLADAAAFIALVRSAGAIFVGGITPTAFGDYVAGSNHVLPTGGAARFSSPLSVTTFLRHSSLVELTPSALALLTPPLAELATSEGFWFHRRSAELRRESE